MSETVETETVYVKEECGAVDVKEEPAEEQDPLSWKKVIHAVSTYLTEK